MIAFDEEKKICEMIICSSKICFCNAATQRKQAPEETSGMTHTCYSGKYIWDISNIHEPSTFCSVL